MRSVGSILFEQKATNTESETWRDAPSSGENSGVNRDGSQFNREGGYNRPSCSHGGGDRPCRLRLDNESEDHPQHTYSSDRSYHPRFNPNRENGDCLQHSYGNNVGDGRPYRPRYNSGDGDHPQRSYGNNAGDSRPYRPRYNSEGGNRPQHSCGNNIGGNHPYRPHYNSEGSDHPQRSYDDNVGGNRPYRPRYNSESGDRPRRSYGNNAGGDRPYRSHYNSEGGDRPQRPYGNRDSYSRPIRRTVDYDPNAKYSKKKQTGYKEQFINLNEPIHLNKFLANVGACPRREADEFITADTVSMNGEVVTELDTRIKRSDEVKFHDQAASVERKIYVLLSEPKNTVMASDDPQTHRTAMDLMGGACSERIYPMDRLDRNITGVLLLANDDDLAFKLTHPKYLKKKIYRVHLNKNLTKADMEQTVAGIQLDDDGIQADAISYTDDSKKDEMGAKAHFGRNRIMHRIFESLGYKVVRLDRVLFAGLIKRGSRRGE